MFKKFFPILVLFCFFSPSNIVCGFYEEESRRVVASINQQISQGLNADRRHDYERNFGAKIHSSSVAPKGL